MATTKRGYLPRSTMDYAAIRGIYEYAEKNNMSFGKAVEKLLLESPTFNQALDNLAKEADWFKKDVEDFKKETA